MNLKKSTTLFIILSIVLACLLVTLGVFTYHDYKSSKAVVGALEEEKKTIKNELSELIVKYDSVQFENIQMKKILEETKGKLGQLQKELDRDQSPEVHSLLRYRKQIGMLKAEQFRLLRLNDSLLAINVEIKDSLSERSIALDQANDLTAILKEENTRLASIVDKNEKTIREYKKDYLIAVKRIEAEALRVRSNGRKFLTEKAKRAEQVRVCFSITTESKSATDVIMYLKVKNPKGKIVGVPVSVKTSNGILQYSDKKAIEYMESEGKACFIVEVSKKEMIPGFYKTELFYKHKMIGFSEFELQ